MLNSIKWVIHYEQLYFFNVKHVMFSWFFFILVELTKQRDALIAEIQCLQESHLNHVQKLKKESDDVAKNLNHQIQQQIKHQEKKGQSIIMSHLPIALYVRNFARLTSSHCFVYINNKYFFWWYSRQILTSKDGPALKE